MAITRDKILKTAEKYVQKGKLEQAIREYEKLLKVTPGDTNTINRLGDLYGRIGEIDKAVARYERVAEQFSDQGFISKSIAIYKKINRLAPQRLDIFEQLGFLYIEQGLKVEAKNQFQMLADHYAGSGDIDNAVRAQERLCEIDPHDLHLKLKVADLMLESGSPERAMEAYGSIGQELIQQNQLDRAERLYRRLIDQDLPSGEVMAPICERLLDVGRVTTAQEFLTAGLGASPTSIPLRTIQVRTLMLTGDTAKAKEFAREILEVEPENADVRGLVGDILMSDGDEQEATEMMIPAAEALLESAEYPKAQKMLRELVERAPTDERILRLAMRAFRPSGDEEMLTRLTASLADVCFSNGREDQARRLYLELIAADPTNNFYRKRLAQLDHSVGGEPSDGDVSGGEDEFPSEISFTIDGDELAVDEVEAEPAGAEGADFDPSERINEAAVFAKYGLSDKAIKHLEEVIRVLPDHAGAREALANTFLSVGQRDKATDAVAPLIEGYRSAGDLEAAGRLEKIYGTQPTMSDKGDDEAIIIDFDDEESMESAFDKDQPAATIFDGDEPTSVRFDQGEPAATTFNDVVSKDLDFSEIDLTDIAAGVDGVGGLEASGIGDDAAEAEVIEEELIEINTEVEGPSYNEMAQLDLFIDQELYEDALGILDRLDIEYPGHPDLAERRGALEGLGGHEESPGSPVAAEDVAASDAAAPAESVAAFESIQTSDGLFADEEPQEYIDLARELEKELAEEEAMVEQATGRGKGEAMLDEVFKEFQKGVAEQLSDDDSDTHFNLGIAYKEMELLEEAIVEFQVASHDPAFFVEACSMIAVCSNDLGRYDEAAGWYQKALVAPDLTSNARTALRYELASAFEKNGDVEQAAGLFEEIRTLNPAYRDVSARLAALSQQQRHVN